MPRRAKRHERYLYTEYRYFPATNRLCAADGTESLSRALDEVRAGTIACRRYGRRSRLWTFDNGWTAVRKVINNQTVWLLRQPQVSMTVVTGPARTMREALRAIEEGGIGSV